MWLIYGSQRAQLGELVQSGEMNQFTWVSLSRLIIQILIYRGVHYFVKPSKRMVWFLVRPWSEPISLIQSVPQGLVLGPAVFNIYLGDLFLILNDIDIVCYDDDNTQYKACYNVDAVFKTLKMSVEKLFKRFKDNQMKGRTDKCHQILSTGDSN